jgi:DNA-directed RNA polymerase subunit RPC12/RpoP
MGAKHVCFSCRKAFNVPYGHTGPNACPDCGQSIVVLPHRFRPPKKRDEQKWETVKYLVSKGFFYEHIGYENLPFAKRPEGYKVQNYVRYPENLREAKEFVIIYQAHARSKE